MQEEERESSDGRGGRCERVGGSLVQRGGRLFAVVRPLQAALGGGEKLRVFRVPASILSMELANVRQGKVQASSARRRFAPTSVVTQPPPISVGDGRRQLTFDFLPRPLQGFACLLHHVCVPVRSISLQSVQGRAHNFLAALELHSQAPAVR